MKSFQPSDISSYCVSHGSPSPKPVFTKRTMMLSPIRPRVHCTQILVRSVAPRATECTRSTDFALHFAARRHLVPNELRRLDAVL
jgi:hypothetical protein